MKKLLLLLSFCFLFVISGGAEGTETWVKVTEAPTDWSGDYLIVYEDGSVAFDGSLTTLDVASNTQSGVTIVDEVITTTDCGFYFTINSAGNTEYTIQSKSGYYIGRTTNSNGFNSSTTTAYKNAISINSDKTANIISGGAYLRYNADSNQKRFRYYKSSSYKAQQAITLYKKQAEGNPTPAAPVFSIEGGEVNNKTEVTITSETGSTLSLYLGEVTDPVASTTEGSITYTISGSVGETIVLTAKVTNVYGNVSSATYTFSILNPKASKTATWRIVGGSASSGTLTNDVNSANGVWTAKQTDGGGFYLKATNPYRTGAVAQLGSKASPFNGTLTLSNSDLTNISFIQSIIVTASSFNGITTTVTAVIGETESNPQVVAAATISDTADIPSITFSPIDIQSDKISFNISSEGGTLIKAISIVYRDDEHPFSDEATYIKLEAGKSVEDGNFVVLSYNNIAVSRADASQGAEVTLSEDGDIVLAEGQNSIDEFEVVSSGNTINGKSCFYLYGGVDNGVEKNRHYLGTPSFVTNETEAAEFYVDDAALLRYKDGNYLAYVGGAFVKSADSTGAVTLYVNDSGITTDVEAVEIEDADAPVEYYNLQGVRVANPQNGLYIVRQGNKVSKQIIR